MRIVAVIPARFGSSRFPGKPLAPILGKPMIERVYRRVASVKGLTSVVVATDDARIADCVRAFGGEAVMTAKTLASGSDRVAAAVARLHFDWVLNVQGDEPLVSPAFLSALLRRARQVRGMAILTAATPIQHRRELNDPNTVKAVFGGDGRAFYFSRSPVPHGIGPVWKHLGIYLFHRRALLKFVKTRPTPLEKMERLEQLRALETGIPIYVIRTGYSPVAVDVPGDISRVENILRKGRHAQ